MSDKSRPVADISGEIRLDGDALKSWPEKLREAAAWFDLIDDLLAHVTVTNNAMGYTVRLIDRIGEGRVIQDDLLRLADGIACHDADREMGRCAAPIEFYAAVRQVGSDNGGAGNG